MSIDFWERKLKLSSGSNNCHRLRVIVKIIQPFIIVCFTWEIVHCDNLIILTQTCNLSWPAWVERLDHVLSGQTRNSHPQF